MRANGLRRSGRQSVEDQAAKHTLQLVVVKLQEAKFDILAKFVTRSRLEADLFLAGNKSKVAIVVPKQENSPAQPTNWFKVIMGCIVAIYRSKEFVEWIYSRFRNGV